MRTYHRWCLLAMLAVGVAIPAAAQEKDAEKKEPAKPRPPVSFARDVFPIISKNCMPCHAEDQFNPSELSLDSYELLMKGGKHGDVGQAREVFRECAGAEASREPAVRRPDALRSPQEAEEGAGQAAVGRGHQHHHRVGESGGEEQLSVTGSEALHQEPRPATAGRGFPFLIDSGARS